MIYCNQMIFISDRSQSTPVNSIWQHLVSFQSFLWFTRASKLQFCMTGDASPGQPYAVFIQIFSHLISWVIIRILSNSWFWYGGDLSSVSRISCCWDTKIYEPTIFHDVFDVVCLGFIGGFLPSLRNPSPRRPVRPFQVWIAYCSASKVHQRMSRWFLAAEKCG